MVGKFDGWPYEISNWGRVRSKNSHHNSKNGLMGVRLSHDGYLYLKLCNVGKHRIAKVHQLVAEAFKGLRPSGLIPNHEDGDKQHNVPDNLVWGTRSYNDQHAFNLGLRVSGTPRKLLETQVIEIRRLNLVEKITKAELARTYGVSEANIYSIVKGKTYKNVR